MLRYLTVTFTVTVGRAAWPWVIEAVVPSRSQREQMYYPNECYEHMIGGYQHVNIISHHSRGSSEWHRYRSGSIASYWRHHIPCETSHTMS